MPFLLLLAQDTRFENYGLKPSFVNRSFTNLDGRKVVRVSRDTTTKGGDQPTFLQVD